MVASRVTHAVKTIGIERVAVHGSFAPNGSSAIVAASNEGKGFSVARTSTGLFTLTMDNAYPALVAGDVTVQRPSGSAPTLAQLGSYVAASKTLGINTYVGGSAATIPVPLTSLRETVQNNGSSNVPEVSDDPATDDPDGFGGLLAQNTTPILDFINPSTDRALAVLWPAADRTVIAFQVPLPTNLNTSSAINVAVRAAMGGTTDTGSIALSTYFNEGDTAVADSISGISGTSYAAYNGIISPGDIPTGAKTMTCELTPGAHGNDALYVSSIELAIQDSGYAGGMALSDLTANANTRIHFNLWFRNTSVDY